MGLLQEVAGPLSDQFQNLGTGLQVTVGFFAVIVLSVVLNVLSQALFKNANEPPLVFHWFPFVGSTITYGMDPPTFFKVNREKYGDIFTFVLLGKRTTVAVGPQGNDFILNGKLKDVNAEEIYTVLTTPVFGRDVVYDCPNAKLMEQKKFMKIALTTEAFRSYVPIIADEVSNYFKRNPDFKANSGVVNLPPKMAEITIFTASHALQGAEIRNKFDETLAALYHDLDMGFTPINFTLHWAPLPWNKKRDHAQRTVAQIYMDTIKDRRDNGRTDGLDIMSHLMNSTYKNGTKVPDHEIAHMMIALLMAGQHSSSSTSSWIMLRLAQYPQIMEELYQEQVRVLGADLPPLKYEDLAKLPLNQAIIKETLRLHAPIHSIMRAVKSPMPVPGTKFVIPTSHTLLAAPGVSGTDPAYFPNPEVWDPHRWEADSPNAPKIGGKDAEDEEKVDYGYGLVSKGAASPYLPFGAGRHRCIGEQFANVQLQTITAMIVREFKFRNADGSDKLIGTDYASLFSRPLEPANIYWEKREAIRDLRPTPTVGMSAEDENLGPLVRLWGLRTEQLPAPSATTADLAPFLIAVLQEAVPFIDAVAPKDGTARPSEWKAKGTKSYPESTAQVELYERVIPAAELEKEAARNSLSNGVDAPETWACRRSIHKDRPSKGTAAWEEFVKCFKDDHVEAEKAFTPNVMEAREALAWDCAGVAVEEGGSTWDDFRVGVFEIKHKLGMPLKNRVFPELIITAKAREADEFIVVSIPMADLDKADYGGLVKEKGIVMAAYVSVERVRKTPTGAIEWIMATASDAKGVLPAWIQARAVLGVVAKDVALFLGWIAEEREKGTSVGKWTAVKGNRTDPNRRASTALEDGESSSQGRNSRQGAPGNGPIVPDTLLYYNLYDQLWKQRQKQEDFEKRLDTSEKEKEDFRTTFQAELNALEKQLKGQTSAFMKKLRQSEERLEARLDAMQRQLDTQKTTQNANAETVQHDIRNLQRNLDLRSGQQTAPAPALPVIRDLKRPITTASGNSREKASKTRMEEFRQHQKDAHEAYLQLKSTNFNAVRAFVYKFIENISDFEISQKFQLELLTVLPDYLREGKKSKYGWRHVVAVGGTLKWEDVSRVASSIDVGED
ncbi:Eburicol 14-alpha-demethylase [Colletotrichum sp. SAR11_57]|nr:Eburicol 14-alpha-demethylase [Colletotrichum sp. SAR11_57]